MKRTGFFIIVLCVMTSIHYAQDSTRSDPYTTSQNIALYSMTGIIVPLALAGTVISFLPPSGGVVIRNGVPYGTMSVETGFGNGRQLQTGEFTDQRISVIITHVFHSKIRDVYRVEYKRDFHFDFVDRRKIFLSGVHVSAGVFSDFPNHGYSVGGGAWLKSPWLPFFGFFPSHTYGLTYRYNAYFTGPSFQEVSFGIASIITF